MASTVEEIFLPHEAHPDSVSLASSVRGTVILGSVRSLRTRGLGDRYFDKLQPAHREAISGLTAVSWLPIDVAIAHYDACEALALDRPTIEEIGRESGLFLNRTLLTVVSRISREAGATPWFPLSNAHKFRARTWVGSSIAVYKQGPKEARFEWIKFPIAHIPYVRTAVGAFVGAIGGLFARAMFVKDLEPRSVSSKLTYRLSWA